jgi:hypothetical protein
MVRHIVPFKERQMSYKASFGQKLHRSFDFARAFASESMRCAQDDSLYVEECGYRAVAEAMATFGVGRKYQIRPPVSTRPIAMIWVPVNNPPK